MKATCLLLCIAFAQGHIFKRHHPKLDRLNVYQYSEEQNQVQRKQNHVSEATAPRIYDQIRPESWSSYEPTKTQSEVSSAEAREIRERQQQQTPQINTQKETLQQYRTEQQPHGARNMMDTYMNNNGANYMAMELSKQKAWSRPKYLAFDSLPAQQWRDNQQEIDQQQNVPVPHDSTSAENSWETREITDYAIPTIFDTMTDRVYHARSEEQPIHGNEMSWNGIQLTVRPRINDDHMKEEIDNIFAEARKTMKHLSKERKQFFHQYLERTADQVDEDAQLNATQLLNKYEYAVETHKVKTDDGYILTLFRILPKIVGSVQKPVVFLMHGLLGSADDWLLMGPNKSLAFMLADNGYEVWLGNARGNKYSRHHVSKYPAQADFWQFGNDEIALHDLPAMIDYSLETSGQSQLHYVGYSQGTTAFFALVAARPEYNQKIYRMSALSPMAYMSEARSPMLRMITPTSPFFKRLHEELGHGEFKPSKKVVQSVGGSMCENEIGCRHICSNVNFVIAGANVENMDVDRIPVIMSHLPAGGSTRQMKQYAQAVASRDFTKYDYGSRINQEVYGSSQPPKYDLSKVEMPVTLFYSEEDWLAHPKDVERLAKELPHAEAVNVGENFSHMDFLVSKNAPKVVYAKLMDSIKKTSADLYV